MAGVLADALESIGRKSIAEKLLGDALGGREHIAGLDDTIQVNKLQKKITEIQANAKQLEEEGFKVKERMKELEQKLAKVTHENQDLEDRCQELQEKNSELVNELRDAKQQTQAVSSEQGVQVRARMKELEGELATATKEKENLEERCQELQQKNSELVNELRDAKQQTQCVSSEQDRGVDLDSSRQEDPENTRDQAGTEREITVQLKLLNEELYKGVVSKLQAPEVKEDKLETRVMVDRLIRLSVTLQELYTTTLSKAPEACKCSEEVKREFSEFAYYGLRAEHNDLVHRVKELISVEEKMTSEEKSELFKLKQLQTNRQRQVDELEKLWGGLFSPPESLPKTCSAPSAPSGYSTDSEKKDSKRHNSYPSRQSTSIATSTTSDDETHEVSFTKPFKWKKTFFSRKKSNNENSCCLVSYSPIAHRYP